MSIALTSGAASASGSLRGAAAAEQGRCDRLGVCLLIWTLLPVYNMLLIALDADADEFTGSIWPPDPDFSSFASVWNEDYWLTGAFLAPVRQQHLSGRRDDGADRADRLARQLRAEQIAVAQRLDRHRLRAADLCAADGVPGDPVRAHHASLRAVGQSVGGHRGDGDVRHALRDPDPASIRQADSDGVGRVGEGRRRVAVAGVSAHLSAADGARAGGGRCLCAAAGVERISLSVSCCCHRPAT